LAFLPSNLRRVCALHTDRLDAQRQADFSLMRKPKGVRYLFC
jgi:hypothetical protein